MQDTSITNYADSVSLNAGQSYPIEIHLANPFNAAAIELFLKEHPLKRRHFRMPPATQGTPPHALLTNSISYRAASDEVTFVPHIMGTPPFLVQWFTKGQPVPGATNLTLTLRNLTFESDGDYTFAATNQFGSATGGATLTVLAPPVLTITNAQTQIVTVNAAPELSYRLQSSGNLKDWSPVWLDPKNGTQSYSNSVISSRRFFRIQFEH